MNTSISIACARHLRNCGDTIIKDQLHLLVWESGGIISNVCAGPYKFTTNRLADGILEPACTEQTILTSSNQRLNALAVYSIYLH